LPFKLGIGTNFPPKKKNLAPGCGSGRQDARELASPIRSPGQHQHKEKKMGSKKKKRRIVGRGK